MTKRSKRFGALVPLGAALAVVAAGIAVAAGTAGASRTQVHAVNAVAYRLTADLTAAQEVPAVNSAARGHFSGVLIRTGIGVTRVASLAGCKVITPPRRSGLPFKISCGGAVVVLPAAPGQWRLVWHLSVAALSGPVTGVDIHLAAAGHAAPTLVGLCGPCRASGHVLLSAGQGTALATADAYVNVDTAAHPTGEIRGQIKRTAFGYAAGLRLQG